MANKLKVAEPFKRYLSTIGTKAFLVQRLVLACIQDKKSLKFTTTGLRGPEDDDSECGSKREILERPCAESEDVHEEAGKEKDEEGGASEKKNEVTSTKKGTAVVDQYLPDDIKTHYHVLYQEGECYDATLNQTNVADNKNKFYVIQVLESNDGGKFMVYNRWGRVGIKGQDKLQGPYTSRNSATQEFEAKFFGKTKNKWSNQNEFIGQPKCYTWLEMDHSMDIESDVEEKLNSIINYQPQPQETKIDFRIANFISLLCNVGMMQQQVMGLGSNAKKLPLGKLSKSTISKGYDVLRRISDVIGKSDWERLEQLSGGITDVICQSDRERLEQLSGEFYTLIPHDFGFRKIREYIIDTPYKLRCKLEMVEDLGEIQAATSLKDDIYSQEKSHLYYQYQDLHCELMPLEVSSKEFSMIESYVQNTMNTGKEVTCEADIVAIFRASRKGESERFKKFSGTKNRMLLWHGSRLKNWNRILSQGLRIAPPEAPASGDFFGKGVYFADMFSNSAEYCRAGPQASDGVLVLCEVALGDMNELLDWNSNADKLLNGKLSTKGVGKIAPDFSEVQFLEDGLTVPLGKTKVQPEPKVQMYNTLAFAASSLSFRPALLV